MAQTEVGIILADVRRGVAKLLSFEFIGLRRGRTRKVDCIYQTPTCVIAAHG